MDYTWDKEDDEKKKKKKKKVMGPDELYPRILKDVFTQSRFNEAPLLDRSALRMNDISVSTEGVIKPLKGLNPSKAMGPDE